jgi:xanthine dehydrogenase accessory factor
MDADGGMSDWLDTLAALRARRAPCVLVTVVEALGSTPRDAGTKMVVTADALHGTIGGGNLEHKAIGEARRLLDRGETRPRMREFPLGPLLGQCCGGSTSILFEPMVPVARRLWLFGAGHVGRAVVDVLGGLPVAIDWVDPRVQEFPETVPPEVTVRVEADPAALVAGIPAGAAVLVMTHSHALDEAIVATALARDDLAYVGLIGSDTKRARFAKRFRAQGLAPERVVCPIGVEGIADKHPRAIAIATAAQLLAMWEAGERAVQALPLRQAQGEGVGVTDDASS